MENKLKPYLLLAPISILVILIMGVGILNCIFQSIGYIPSIGLNNFTLDYYKEILRDETFLKSLIFSLKISFISSFICVVVGTLLAYALSKNKYSKLKVNLLNLPIIVPHIVVVIIVFMIFSQSGILSRILYNLGVIKDSSEFTQLVLDENGIGIILVYLWKGIPFVIITAYNILKNISESLENVAINLGANKFQAFRFIILPLAMPSIISSFIILFAFSFGSFEVPFLIGPSTPKALSVQAYISYSSSDLMQRPIAMSVNVILSGVSIFMLLIYNKVFSKIYKDRY
ncbi:ABC transporter permease subunit [Clostridium sp. CCUG 7971]|uniref:ABC transporter permease n=1 Tax=Clostridium sp. CCUG 7971 TaxID=2811414 RepID=UPI001ABA3BAB|nr:ABC transporter permease subunit [Clostridium sp. CCUG 7971]